MVGQRMMLFAKRFRPAFAEAPARRTRLWQAGLRAGRSKAPSAASLPSGQLVGCQRIGFHSMEFFKTPFLKTSVDMPFYIKDN
jgi:hypothetical protein